MRALALASLGDTVEAQAAYDKSANILKNAKAAADARPTVEKFWADFAICETLQREFAQKQAVAVNSQSDDAVSGSDESE